KFPPGSATTAVKPLPALAVYFGGGFGAFGLVTTPSCIKNSVKPPSAANKYLSEPGATVTENARLYTLPHPSQACATMLYVPCLSVMKVSSLLELIVYAFTRGAV